MSDKEHHEGCDCHREPTNEELFASQADAKVNLACMWVSSDRLDAAEVHLAAASKLYDMSGLKDRLPTNYYLARSAIAQKRGQLKAALRHSRAAYAVARSHHAADSHQVAVAQANFGECLAESGNKDKGLEVMAAGLAKLKAADVGCDPMMVAWKESAINEISGNIARLS